MEENEDPEKNEQFMKLPLTIENFFKELIIDCECDERKIRPKCEQLGARHIDFSGRGFHSNFWDIFLVCMMEVIGECSMKCSENQKRVCVLAWNRLLNAVVKDMRAGYDNRRRSIGHRKSKQDE
ncbi:unnamed protein product [Toxocara canis]|nr:unnamed protein product [Toxocara canis]